MANYKLIYPLKNKDDFKDLEKLSNILSKNIKELDFTITYHNNKYKYISVSKNNQYLFDISINNFNILNFDEDIKILDDENENDLAYYYTYLMDNNPDFSLEMR